MSLDHNVNIDTVIRSWTSSEDMEGMIEEIDGFFHMRDRLTEDPTNILYMLYPDANPQEYKLSSRNVLDNSVHGSAFATQLPSEMVTSDQVERPPNTDVQAPKVSSIKRKKRAKANMAINDRMSPVSAMAGGSRVSKSPARKNTQIRKGASERSLSVPNSRPVPGPSASLNQHTSVCKVPSRLKESFTIPRPLVDILRLL